MTRPNKIVHVNLAKSFRGGEVQTLELVKSLQEYGVAQEVICRRNSPMVAKLLSLKDIQISQVSGPLSGHLGRKKWGKNTILHAHEARAVYWAWIEKLIRRAPYLVTRRVINQVSKAWTTKKAYQAASALVGVSSFAADVLARQVHRPVGIVLDACRTFPPAANENCDGEKLGDWAGSPRIGHVGALDDEVKGQSLLIEAFIRLLPSYPDARLFLVGDGKDRSVLMDRCKGEDRIVFTGAVSNVHEWLQSWDVFCFPSRVEALGSSVLEAMSAGVPVVVSGAGGLPELVGNQERGRVVIPREPDAWAAAIEEVLKQPEMTARRVASAKAFAQANNAACMAGQYWDIYNRLLV